MTETIEQLSTVLRAQIQPGAREKLVAKGLARSIIWADGVLPEGAPSFKKDLTDDLLDHGFSILSRACRLKDMGGDNDLSDSAFRIAAESIEAAVRRGEVKEEWRPFYFVSAASAFHIAQYAARAFSLMAGPLDQFNLSTPESILVSLMRRDLDAVRARCFSWRNDPENSDDEAARRLEADDTYLPEQVVTLALTSNFINAMSQFLLALTTGNPEYQSRALGVLNMGAASAAKFNHVTAWWIHTLARHIIAELWDATLHVRLPKMPSGEDSERWNALRASFIRILRARRISEIDLWPSQLEAAQRAIEPTDDLIVALPTSAGKTKIAEMCILRCLASNRRVVYVTPLRALSAQVERTLSNTFRPLGISITSLYGASGVAVADIDALASNQIVVATPEKLDFAIRQQPDLINDVGLVVLDEGHMIGLGSREVRYEVLVQRLLARVDANSRRLVCLSAIFKTGGTFSNFVEWMRSDVPGTAITNSWRPTRQRPAVLTWTTKGAGRLQLLVDGEQPFVPAFVKLRAAVKPRRTPFPRNDPELVIACADEFAEQGQAVLVYCPTRRSVESLGRRIQKLQQQRMLANRLLDPTAIERAVTVGNEWLGPKHIAVEMLKCGIAIHHGGLPRQFLAEIEALLNLRQDNPLKLTIASPTLAQGLDLSCSTLVFQSLYRNGTLIPAQEYSNVIGRVGRAFVDIDGVSIFTSYEAGKKRAKRVQDYNTLRRQAITRDMESGILLLIEEIASRLAARLEVDAGQLLDYVVNQGASFGATIAQILEGDRAEPELIDTDVDVSEEEEERDDGPSLESLVDDLDTAILATVENLDAQATELADLLDAALRNSLWSRRLAGRSENIQKLQRKIIEDRAQWIWSHSTGAQRRGFFSAGIGLDGGTMLAAILAELVPNLMRAEIAFDDDNLQDAMEPICAIIDRMMKIPPFDIKKVPENWTSLVKGWISGDSLSSLIEPSNATAFEFVQDGLVYRMVWAFEAIRVYAISVGALTGDELFGRSSLSLTYGTPTINSALLLQAGLPSRTMAVNLDRRYPAARASARRFTRWLTSTIQRFNAETEWPENVERQIWNDFVSSWQRDNVSNWVHDIVVLELPVGSVEAVQEDVSIIEENDAICVADSEFRRLTTIAHNHAGMLCRYGTAKLQDAKLAIDYFGPPMDSASGTQGF